MDNVYKVFVIRVITRVVVMRTDDKYNAVILIIMDLTDSNYRTVTVIV